VRRGFTLLEVMVAIAILGIGLTVILTSQTGLFSSANRAAKLSMAIGLARCKMSEVEAKLLRDGFPITDETEEGPCCEDDESRFHCSWSINTVTMPELGAMASGPDAGAGAEDPLAGLLESSNELMGGDTQGAITGLSGMLGGGASEGPSMGAGALAPMAMGLIYPQLKAMLEASIRKIIVTVHWEEGSAKRDMSVSQYLTNPQQGGFLGADPNAEVEPGQGGSGGTGATPRTGTGGRRQQ
jgi:general secretion pathway protein I